MTHRFPTAAEWSSPSETGLPSSFLSNLSPVRFDTAHLGGDELAEFRPPIPSRIVLPEGHEPSYAYPLIIWLHGDGETERELLRLLPRISERNHIGLSFRGFLRGSNRIGYRWANDARLISRFWSQMQETVDQVMQLHCVHPDRIYLAGADRGAELATQLLWHRPEFFAGAVAVRGRFDRLPGTIVNHERLAGKRLLLAETAPNMQGRSDDLLNAARLFHTSGLDVTTRAYETNASIPGMLLTEIDRWILSAISTAVC